MHETAVSWIRFREERCRVRNPCEETVPEFTARLRGIVQEINDKLDVEQLCRDVPKRLQELVDRKGDRIPH